jgi:hypothetical protein
MSDSTFEKLRNRITDDLNPQIREFEKMVVKISNDFRLLGLEMAVWHPEKIHCANMGGIEADSYVGYSRVEGKWGLMIRTIERDCENNMFIGQRLMNIESCGNMEIVAGAVRKTGELLRHIQEVVDKQIKVIASPR